MKPALAIVPPAKPPAKPQSIEAELLPYDRHETAADIAERIRKGIKRRPMFEPSNWRAPK